MSALVPDKGTVNFLDEDDNGLRYYDRVILAWAGDDRFEDHKTGPFVQALLYAFLAADEDAIVRLRISFPLLEESWQRMLPHVHRLKGRLV